MSGPFTIPSGIVSTAPSIIQRLFDDSPEIGLVTTKSVGLGPRAGNREPIYSQYAPGCYINAVGLTNPGAYKAREEFEKLARPSDRFLLISIFGSDIAEFVEVAKLLAPVADGLELNLSCPHADGFGMAMGQDPVIVEAIVRAVKRAVNVPIIPKLTPNVEDIKAIGQAAIKGGADALCAINTVGPGYTESYGESVLSNGVGGLSGKGVLPLALRCIRDLRDITDRPIIGCGGLSSATDCRAAREAGATIIGIGSALSGLTTKDTVTYFRALAKDLETEANAAKNHIRFDLEMDFRSFRVIANERVCDDIAIITLDSSININAGEYVFIKIPGVGEKPFSCLTDSPLRLAVIDVGAFTHACFKLRPGDTLLVRGPYGLPVSPTEDSHIVCVAGGTGLAAVYQIARDFGMRNGPIALFAGARTANRLYFIDECIDVAEVHIATDDGSAGFKGLITEALAVYLRKLPPETLACTEFYNCGPKPMIRAAEIVQREFVPESRIFSAIDYTTKCGVGICGACASPDGRRICVDGPFISSSG